MTACAPQSLTLLPVRRSQSGKVAHFGSPFALSSIWVCLSSVADVSPRPQQTNLAGGAAYAGQCQGLCWRLS